MMGQNLILNMNDNGFKVCAFNRTVDKVRTVTIIAVECTIKLYNFTMSSACLRFFFFYILIHFFAVAT